MLDQENIDPVIRQLLKFVRLVQENNLTKEALEILYFTICDSDIGFNMNEQSDASELLAKILERLKTSFSNTDAFYFDPRGIYEDFITKGKERISCSVCGHQSIKNISEASINLPISTNKLQFLVIIIGHNSKTNSQYRKEYNVTCEMDVTVSEVKQKINFGHHWELYIVNQNCSLEE